MWDADHSVSDVEWLLWRERTNVKKDRKKYKVKMTENAWNKLGHLNWTLSRILHKCPTKYA